MGGDGNDVLFGDSLTGFHCAWSGYGYRWGGHPWGSFDDYLDGGAGNDVVFAGTGDDIAVYVVSENSGAKDYYDGNDGSDTLKLVLTQAEYAAPDIQANIQAFQDFLAGTSNPHGNHGPVFHFAAFDLTARNFEHLEIEVVGGSEQPPVAEDDDAATNEDNSITIAVLANDDDPDGNNANMVVSSYDASGLLGTLTLNPDNTFTYDPGSAFQSLANGQTAQETFTYVVEDEQGLHDTATVTVTITGVNDVAVIGGETVGAVTEDADPLTLMTGGLLTISDVDAGEAHFAAQAGTAGSYGSFTLDAAGNWTYSADNTQIAIQQLGEGATLTDSFTATSLDGSASQPVTVTITGVNDTAVIGGVTVGAVTEDADPATLMTGGLLTISDVDAGEAAFVAQTSTAGLYGTFTLDAAGNWTYSADNTQIAIQSLGDGATLTDSFTAASLDGSASQLVTITITGVNDTAVIGGVTAGAVTEDADPTTLTASGALTIADVDTGEASFVAQASTAGSYGSFTLDAAGNWTYSADNTQIAIQSLGDGATLTDSFTAESLDGSASQLVTITITGVNDTAVIGGVTVGAVTEDADPTTLTASGALTIADVDTGEASFVAQASTAGSYGSFTLDAAGNWTYSADNTQIAIQSLGDGATLTDSFTAESLDGSASQLVTITITGVNDTAVIGGVTVGAVSEDADPLTLSTDGLLTISDVDAGEASFVAQTSTARLYGTFTLAADGNWSYSADNTQAAIQSLGEGATLTDSFTAVSLDGTTQDITITINGVDDPPTITSPDTAAIDENTTAVITVTADDPDVTDTIAFSITGGDDQALFSIDANTGALSFIDAPDYENPGDAGGDNIYEVEVTADDDHGSTDSQLITVAVNDVTGVNLVGTPESDILIGTSEADTFRGLASADILDGLGGNDTFYAVGTESYGDTVLGGDGTDTLQNYTGGDGNLNLNGATTLDSVEILDGTLHAKPLFATNYLYLDDGGTFDLSSVTTIRDFDAVYNSGTGDQTIDLSNLASLSSSGYVLNFNQNDDSHTVTVATNTGLRVTVNTGGGNDTVTTGAGNDTINAGAGADVLYGGEGDDVFRATQTESYGDTLHGGDGTDTLQNNTSGDGNLNLNGATTLDSVEILDGTLHADPLFATDYLYLDGDGTFDLSSVTTIRDFDAVYNSGTGDQTIDLSNLASLSCAFYLDQTDQNTDITVATNTGINTTVYMGGGDDTVTTGAGVDSVSGGDGGDEISTGAGDDTFRAVNTEPYGDTLHGGDGTDKLQNYTGGDGNLNLNGATTLDSVEILDGTLHAKPLFATNYLYLDDGGTFDLSSVTTIRDFDAVYNSGTGDQTIDLSNLASLSSSGYVLNFNQNDNSHTVMVATNTGLSVTVNMGGGDDTIATGAGSDRLNGGAGSDTVSYAHTSLGVTVDLAAATAGGTEVGSDVFTSIENAIGGAGNDTLLGSGGANELVGGAGDDSLTGGSGDDTLTGGGDADTFVFAPDFGHDTITDFAPGTDTIAFSTSVFADADAVIAAATDDGADTTITVDADNTITLDGILADHLSAADFDFF